VTIFDFFTRHRVDSGTLSVPDPDSQQASTKALARFLSTLGTRPQPVLVDLGPVVGSNVTFFTEQLGCRLVVEDVLTDIDRHVREQTLASLPEFFAHRFAHEDSSVDGILCWDVFDYLDREAACALAEQLTRMLRPKGMLLAFFSTVEPAPDVFRYTKYLIVDRATLERRSYDASWGKCRPVLSRDIERMFISLSVDEQFLLKAKILEVLFRKPADQMTAGATMRAVAR
jgi:hypothetical protein